MVIRRLHATTAEVWAILADGWRYAAWVPGISRVRAVDPRWPQAGSRLRHGVGPWPLTLDGHTEVLVCEPGRQLVLRSGAGPIGTDRLRIMVSDARPHGCVVRVAQDGAVGAARLLPRRVVERLVASPRHRETVRRLALLAEGRHTLEQRRAIEVQVPKPIRRRIS